MCARPGPRLCALTFRALLHPTSFFQERTFDDVIIIFLIAPSSCLSLTRVPMRHRSVYERIPAEDIKLLSQQLPQVYLKRMLELIAAQVLSIYLSIYLHTYMHAYMHAYVHYLGM